MDLSSIAVLAAVVAMGIGIPFAAFRHDRFGWVFIAAAGIVGAAVAFAVIAFSTDFHDADGFVDCWPECSTVQEVIRWTFWPGALAWLVLVIVAIGRWITDGRD